MFLSRETQSGNQKTKSQMFVTMGDGGNKSTEKIWEENGFFNDQKIDLTIPKVNFPENTLCYVNQGTVSQIKDGNAIYLEYVILSQIMVMMICRLDSVTSQRYNVLEQGGSLRHTQDLTFAARPARSLKSEGVSETTPLF